MQLIEKVQPGKFKVWWEEDPEAAPLTVDFSVFRPWCREGPAVLLHWQARPKGLRRWGLFDCVADQYFGCDWNKLQFPRMVQLVPLQLDERLIQSVPTAVLWIPGARVHIEQGKPVEVY